MRLHIHQIAKNKKVSIGDLLWTLEHVYQSFFDLPFDVLRVLASKLPEHVPVQDAPKNLPQGLWIVGCTSTTSHCVPIGVTKDRDITLAHLTRGCPHDLPVEVLEAEDASMLCRDQLK